MREKLKLPSGLRGNVWPHHNRGPNHFMHSHEELEINLGTAGRATYLVKDQRYDVTAGTLLWLFPDQEHLLIEQSPDFAMWILVFSPELITAHCRNSHLLAQRDPDGNFCVNLPNRYCRRLDALYREVFEARDDAQHCNAGLAYALLNTWRAHEQAEHHAPIRRVHPSVEQAARLMHADPARYRLTNLADEVGLSPSRLSRLFRSQMGICLVTYRQRCCLEQFLELFARSPRQKLISLALDAGFGSYPQFHRVFVQELGKTPADFLRDPH